MFRSDRRPDRPRWRVYTRPECALCEEMMSELALLLGAELSSQVEVVDISGDEALERRYGRKVPVLTVDGDFVCAFRLDRERVQAHLSASRG